MTFWFITLIVFLQSVDPELVDKLVAALPFIFFLVGVTLRVFVPYFQERLTNPTLAFEWRYVVGQLITAILALFPLISTAEFLTEVGAMGWIAALMYGWGVADLGRTAQKSRIVSRVFKS